eukprot:TRINITY_DN13956_c0_g3_i2.p4 TRINITY_DN13956_c0_g3~~TRINITY_DN13956_c0_g3_i2.p4  ORF type:complete len:102 (+),score=30.05 TRINITY_DN13956_c0_g3_i2:424-729(+)
MMPFIHKNFADVITSVDYVRSKIDLAQLNHLTGQTQLYLKLNFRNVQDLVATRNTLRPIVEGNKKREEREGIYWQDNNLSLIHICRCRRSTLCRSRWSPYH